MHVDGLSSTTAAFYFVYLDGARAYMRTCTHSWTRSRGGVLHSSVLVMRSKAHQSCRSGCRRPSPHHPAPAILMQILRRPICDLDQCRRHNPDYQSINFNSQNRCVCTCVFPLVMRAKRNGLSHRGSVLLLQYTIIINVMFWYRVWPAFGEGTKDCEVVHGMCM